MNNPAIKHGGKSLQDINDVAGGALNPAEGQEVETTDTNGEVKSITIDDIFKAVENAPKGKKKVQLTVYIDEEVSKAFTRYAKPLGKGAKSETINKFLKAKFQL